MSQNLQNFAKFQKIQLDNLVDFEKCCKTRIFLQRSAPIQPKTSEILPKIAKNWLSRTVAHVGRGDGGPGDEARGGPARQLLCKNWQILQFFFAFHLFRKMVKYGLSIFGPSFKSRCM